MPEKIFKFGQIKIKKKYGHDFYYIKNKKSSILLFQKLYLRYIIKSFREILKGDEVLLN